MREFVVYTAARLGLFVAAYALVAGAYLLATRDGAVPLFWPLVLAALLSSVASVRLLKGQRERFAAVIDRRARAAADRADGPQRADHPTD